MWVALITAAIASPERASDELSALPPDRLDAPIINGEPATRDDHDSAGAVLVRVDSGFEYVGFLCSSTLIAPDVVMLAAHCLALEVPYDGEVTGFAWDNSPDVSRYVTSFQDSFGILAHDASMVVFHDDYGTDGDFEFGLGRFSDIGLLFLEEPVEDADFAYLPTADEIAQLEVGADAIIVGWGQTEANPYDATVGVKYAADSTVDELGDWEMHVGAAKAGGRKCHGDSGGPTYWNVPETDSAFAERVIGITSRAYDTSDCARTGGVDTRADAYLDWIDAEMRERCADGTRSWCVWEGVIPPPDERGLDAWEEYVPPAMTANEDEARACGCVGLGASAELSWFVLLWPLLAATSRRPRPRRHAGS
jgi:hypothetical protein